MGKIDVIGLPIVGKPGDLLFFGHIFGQEFLFFGRFSKWELWIIMAFCTFCQFGYSRKGAIITKSMAIKASFGICVTFDAVHSVGIQMKRMIEVHWLWLVGIEHHGKDDPPHYQGANKAKNKKDANTQGKWRREGNILSIG
jgi:hypothetical protein